MTVGYIAGIKSDTGLFADDGVTKLLDTDNDGKQPTILEDFTLPPGGGGIQTDDAVDTGLKISSLGMKIWNTSNVQTAEILGDGSGWFGVSSNKSIEWTNAGAVKVGGWAADNTKFSNGNVVLDAANELIRLGAVTDFLKDGIDAGILMGKDGTDYELFAGKEDGDYIHWDGSTLYIDGTLYASAGVIGGFHIGAQDIWAGNGTLGDIATKMVLGDAADAGTPKLALGATADAITITGTEPGFMATGDGYVKAYIDSSNYLRVDAGGVDIVADTFNLNTSTLVITSAPKIAMGTTPPTGVSTGTGIYMDATGVFGLSANTQNFAISATDGSITSIKGAIGGWTIISDYLYKLSSGTPASSPSDGIVVQAGTTPQIIVYDTFNLAAMPRVKLGEFSADIFGLIGYDTDGTTMLYEFSTTQNKIAGWTVSSTTLANSTNIILDASNKSISISDATFGNAGIQLEYNSGVPRAYIGNGSTRYFNFDGTNISWDGGSSSMTTAGLFSTTSAQIGGATNHWLIGAGTMTAVGTGLIRTSSGNARVEINSAGIKAYDTTPTQRVQISNDGSGWFGASDKFSWTAGGTVTIAGWEVSASKIQKDIVAQRRLIINASDASYPEGFMLYRDNDDVGMATGVVKIVSIGELYDKDTLTQSGTDYGFQVIKVTDPAGVPTYQHVVRMSASEIMIAGWNLTDTTLSSANITLDSSNQMISIQTATFGSAGVQIDYSGGTGRLYAGDGSTSFMKFDGANLSWQGANTSLTTGGAFTASSATITGVITANTGYIGGTSGWVIASGKITSTGIGVATAAGDATYAFWAGDDAPASAEFSVSHAGALVATSATITGSITATSGDIGGWNITTGYIYELATGTPTSSPSDGIVMESGATPQIIIYDTFNVTSMPRVKLGELSADVFGLIGYDADGTTALYEFSTAQNKIAGWTVSATTLANSTNIVLDASNKSISINSATWQAQGIQLQYNAGVPRFYVGDGANQYMQFDGTNIAWKGTNTELTAAGAFSATSATITGAITADSGYLGGASGWTITTGKLHSAVVADSTVGLLIPDDDLDKAIYAGADDNIGTDAKFYVLRTGEMRATNAYITGEITAASGTIGGFHIGSQDLWAGNASLADVATKMVLGDAVDVGTPKVALGTSADAITIAGVEAGFLATGDGYMKAYVDSSNYMRIDGSGVDITSQVFNLNTSTLVITSAPKIAMGTTPPTGVSTGTGIYMDATGVFGLSANTQNFAISATDGSITSIKGAIGGWDLTSSLLRSAASGARIELDKGQNRISVFDAVNDKIIMGYLEGVVRNNASGTATSGGASTLTDTTQDWQVNELVGLELYITGGTGSGQNQTVSSNTSTVITVDTLWAFVPDNTSTYEVRYTSTDYGFWARAGDNLAIDGDVTYESGDWLIQHDASYIVQDGSGNTIIKMGTDTGDKGLFIYNTSGTILAKYISDEIYIGEAGKSLSYTTASGLVIQGDITADTGYLGGTSGWVIASGKITSTGIGVATTTGDTTYAFWAGDNIPANAEFSVSHAGALVASSATITGSITSTSGAIGGWDIGADSLTSTNVGLHSAGYTEGAEILLGHATLYASANIGLKADGSGKLASGNFSWDTSGNISGAGTWTNTATITGGVFQTASSGQRIVMQSSDNTLRFHTATQDDVLVITDSVYEGNAGISMAYGGSIDITNATLAYVRFNPVSSNINVDDYGKDTAFSVSKKWSTVATFPSTDTGAIGVSYYSNIIETGGTKYGVKSSSIIDNASSTGGDAVALYGSAVNDGAGSAFAGYFDDGDVYVKNNLRIGTTTDHGGRLNLNEGATAADGIYFGSDVTLYRSAANVLKTDDSITAGGAVYATTYLGVGTTSAETDFQIGDYTDAAETMTIATSANNTGRINFYHTDNTLGASILAVGESTGAKIHIIHRSGNDSLSRFIFDPMQGFFGIGYQDPTAALHVRSYEPSGNIGTPGYEADDVLIVAGGVGGDSLVETTGVGGIGADISVTAGAGGTAYMAATASTGGKGGGLGFIAGDGGAATVSGTGTNIGGDGGDITINPGAGGLASGGSVNTDGSYGNVYIATAGGDVIIGSVINAGLDTDKFLVLDSSDIVKFRTGSELLSDIGALSSSTTSTQEGYFTGVRLWDNSHYLRLITASDLTAAYTLTFDVNDASRILYVHGDTTLEGGTHSGTNTGDNPGVTSVSAGAGMNFTTITGTGSVVMGTPTTLTASTIDSASGTTHEHAVTGFSVTTHTHSYLSSSTTSTQEGYFTGVSLWEGSHYLRLITAADLTAACNLTFDVNDASRILSVHGDTTLNGGTHSGTNTGDNPGVTSVGGTGTVSGITLTGTVTSTGDLTLGGTVSITSANISDVDAFSQTGTYAGLRAQATTKADVGLSVVEDTALSTWAGTTNITTVGSVKSSTASDTDVNFRMKRFSATGRANYTLEDESSNQLWRCGLTAAGGTAYVFWDTVQEVLKLASSGDVTFAQAGNVVISTGSLNVRANVSSTHIFGEGKIHSPWTNYVAFSHYDRANNTDYAILHQDTGATYVNAASGQSVYMRIANANTGYWNDTQLRISVTTAATSPTTGALVVSGGIGIGGDCHIYGEIVKGSGSFRIPHPNPDLENSHTLWHSFVESPTAGDNIYTYEVESKTDDEEVVLSIQDYWKYLNENPRIFVQAQEMYARAYGWLDENSGKLHVKCEKPGVYKILLIGTRVDSIAKKAWKGAERLGAYS